MGLPRQTLNRSISTNPRRKRHGGFFDISAGAASTTILATSTGVVREVRVTSSTCEPLVCGRAFAHLLRCLFDASTDSNGTTPLVSSTGWFTGVRKLLARSHHSGSADPRRLRSACACDRSADADGTTVLSSAGVVRRVCGNSSSANRSNVTDPRYACAAGSDVSSTGASNTTRVRSTDLDRVAARAIRQELMRRARVPQQAGRTLARECAFLFQRVLARGACQTHESH